MTDYATSSRARLVVLINQANNLELTERDIVLGPPLPNSLIGPTGQIRNTSSRLTSSDESIYQFDETIWYNRFSLGEVLTTALQVDNTQSQFLQVHDLIAWLAEHGLSFAEEDLENDVLLNTPEIVEQTIRASASSYGWIGTGKLKIINAAQAPSS